MWGHLQLLQISHGVEMLPQHLGFVLMSATNGKDKIVADSILSLLMIDDDDNYDNDDINALNKP